jgi:hypothetical protein
MRIRLTPFLLLGLLAAACSEAPPTAPMARGVLNGYFQC